MVRHVAGSMFGPDPVSKAQYTIFTLVPFARYSALVMHKGDIELNSPNIANRRNIDLATVNSWLNQ